jgi:hypothetical protein
MGIAVDAEEDGVAAYRRRLRSRQDMLPKAHAMVESNNLRRIQFAATGLWIVIIGGMAVYHTSSVDPVHIDGRKCIFPTSNDYQYKRLNGAGTNYFDQFDPDRTICEIV